MTGRMYLFLSSSTSSNGRWHLKQVEKVARASARVVPSVTVRSYVTTSRVSPSLLSVVLLAVVVSSVSPPWSTKRPVVSSRPSLSPSSGTPSPTPSTPSVRPSRRWMSSMRLSARAVRCMVSVVKSGDGYLFWFRFGAWVWEQFVFFWLIGLYGVYGGCGTVF